MKEIKVLLDNILCSGQAPVGKVLSPSTSQVTLGLSRTGAGGHRVCAQLTSPRGSRRVGGSSRSGAGVGFCGALACPWDFTPVSTLKTALGAGPALSFLQD